MAGLLRGVGSTGLGAAVFGLKAVARRHEEQRLHDHPPGRPLQGAAELQAEAERLLDALELAHGAYRKSAAALAATTCLRAQHIRVWRPEGGRLQPGYYVAVDYTGRRVVWGVRGTRVFSDLLTDLAMAAHPLGGGEAHWGMTHAAHWLLQQEAQRVGALLRSLRPAGSFRLVLVGHSLGGSVAALMAVMLREGLVEAARTSGIPPDSVSCTAFAPAAIVSTPLAARCRPYVTSVVLNNDIVPRFNAASLARLQEEVQSVDWYDELQRTLMDHSMVKSLTTSLGVLSPAQIGRNSADGLQPTPPSTDPPALVSTANAIASGSPVTALASALQPPAAATAAVQQLSAAVLESAALRAAMTALDDWKARAAAAAGDQAESMVRRQAEVFRGWLQDIARGAERLKDAAAEVASTAPPPAAGSGGNSPSLGPSAVDDVRRAAETAAEQLRQSVEAAVAAVTAAAVASKERLSSTLPGMPALPALPQPHELPLVEPVATAAAASAAAATAMGYRARPEAAAGATAKARQGTVTAGELVETRPDAQDDSVVKELPLLYLPGRILYIQPLTAGGAAVPAGREANAEPFGHTATTALPMASTTQSTLRRRLRSAFGGTRTTHTDWTMVALPPGEGFRRVVLGRAALEEHQCRAYRRVLKQLALQL